MLRYRFLFEQMVRRELRQKYQGSALGVLWYIVNPLVLMGAYWLIFGVLTSQFQTENYPLFLMIGLLVWVFFSQALMAAATSLVDQASLVGKVRFPRETVPASVVTVQALTFAAVLLLLSPLEVAVRGTLGPQLLLLPLFVVLLFAFVLGCALAIAVLHAYFRDVAPVLAAALLPWFFLTPIFFRVSDLPGVADHPLAGDLLRWANPIAPFVEAFRVVLFDGHAPPDSVLLYVVAAAGVALSGGLSLFHRLQGELAVVL